MNDITRYKLIALVSVFGAIYSCNSTVDSQNSRSTTAQLQAIQDSIDALSAKVDALDASVAATKGCSTSDFLDGKCASGEVPDDASVSTTYCIAQGRGLQLGAQYAAEGKVELEGGAGWPEVAWVKGTLQATVPFLTPTIPIPLPTQISAAGSAQLGRNLQICVQIPVNPTADEKQQIADLVTGVNVTSGKYSRRVDRLLNYAARRTPVAQVQSGSPGASVMKALAVLPKEDADNAFDVADNAVDQFMANGFQPPARPIDFFTDPIFTDLASSLDLPTSLINTIQDPQQLLGGLQTLSPATACAQLGLDATVRTRFPAVDTFCGDVASLPDGTQVKAVASRVTTITSRVLNMFTISGLENFICDNVSLAVFAPACN